MAVERITYLVANHNHRAFLGDCLDSLERQSSPDWLAIVCDDGSTDGSLDVLRPLAGSRIQLLVNPERAGYTATLIRLIGAASTDIVAVLDADDALAPDATERLLRAYADHPETGFVYSRYAAFDERLEVCRGTFGTPLGPGETALWDGVVGAIRSFRRTAYARTAGLDLRYRVGQDRDLVYKLEEVTRPVFVDAPLYRYRRVPGSHSDDPASREEGIRNVLAARRDAARRRGMRGAGRVFGEAFFRADYRASSARTPAVLRPLAVVSARLARRLVRWSATPLTRHANQAPGRDSSR